jgi:L-ribulose-5-phosphate 3-epimerase UlaE
MMGFDIIGAPAGQGRMDISRVVQKLESIGKCDSMILELWPEPESTIKETIKKEQDWIKQSAQFLFKNFRKL